MLRFAVIVCVFLMAAIPCIAQAQDSDSPEPGAAQNDVRISQLEEQMRRLEGSIEQLSFENKQLKTQIDKMNGDIQYRLTALEQKQAAVAATPAPAQVPETPKDDTGQLKPVTPAPGADTASADAAPTQKFATAREQYNYAYQLMQQLQYEKAAQLFAAFTKKYPKDPLIGNAWFWLGETWYARRDYVKAADSFRQGYEALPTGPKAADNLYKLGTSLDAQQRDKEACVVFRQVAKSTNASGSTRGNAEHEMNRLGCN